MRLRKRYELKSNKKRFTDLSEGATSSVRNAKYNAEAGHKLTWKIDFMASEKER